MRKQKTLIDDCSFRHYVIEYRCKVKHIKDNNKKDKKNIQKCLFEVI